MVSAIQPGGAGAGWRPDIGLAGRIVTNPRRSIQGGRPAEMGAAGDMRTRGPSQLPVRTRLADAISANGEMTMPCGAHDCDAVAQRPPAQAAPVAADRAIGRPFKQGGS